MPRGHYESLLSHNIAVCRPLVAYFVVCGIKGHGLNRVWSANNHSPHSEVAAPEAWSSKP